MQNPWCHPSLEEEVVVVVVVEGEEEHQRPQLV
jgi:hypothetical protein